MTGDDWLNNGVSRNHYCEYLDAELKKESELVIVRVRNKCKHKKISYQSILLVGESNKVLLDYAQHYQHVYVGTHRKKNQQGLNDRMLTKKVSRSLRQKLHVINA